MAKHDDDNRSQQLDPEHDAYWQSRGEDWFYPVSTDSQLRAV